jgi:CDP-diacylglycerol---glycerol-3-phosphate 3-phosphatidyltransferase
MTQKIFISPKLHVRAMMDKLAQYIDSVSGGKITPNMITITGFVAHIGVAALIISQQFLLAAAALVFFGLFDALDGSLARLQKRESPMGMLLDSVTDRLKECIMYTALAYFFVASGQAEFAVFTVVACGISLTISYINAWGEVLRPAHKKMAPVNKKFRIGLMSFETRMLVIIIALITQWFAVALGIIISLGAVTAMQRFMLIRSLVK